MPLDTAWLLAIPCLLISLAALFVLVALLDRKRSRRLRRFEVWSFKPIPRNLLLKMREGN